MLSVPQISMNFIMIDGYQLIWMEIAFYTFIHSYIPFVINISPLSIDFP